MKLAKFPEATSAYVSRCLDYMLTVGYVAYSIYNFNWTELIYNAAILDSFIWFDKTASVPFRQ